MRPNRLSVVAVLLIGGLAVGTGPVLGSWSVEADRVCTKGVTVILTVDGDYVADGQPLDFGPLKKWTQAFIDLGGPGALVNRTVDLAGIVDDDGNLEVYRARGEINGSSVDICTRLAGRPPSGSPRGGGGTPCPGPAFDFDWDCN
ncbi:MAG: hypothetical protein ACE5JH_07900 [Acidobacteriota bacterium]